MKTFILIDGMNTFFRAANTVNPALGIDAQCGMALHTLISSMNKCWWKFRADHMVMCTEGKSWRKSAYTEYKLNRVIANLQKSEKEQEDGKLLLEVYSQFCSYIENKTNISYVRSPNAEADDVIAVWIQNHPEDKHVLISSDTDFVQLLSHPNLTIYDPINDRTLTQAAIYNGKGKKVEFTIKSDGKIKTGAENENFVPEYPNWYEYCLFLKIIRGDKGDNIMSAFPGARLKGSKNKVGINEAFEDRSSKGFNWNNFMLQRYMNHDNVEVVVKDMYDRNRNLIDLTCQPEHIVNECLEAIAAATVKEPVSDLGFHFMKFCREWALNKISDNPTVYTNMLNARYE